MFFLESCPALVNHGVELLGLISEIFPIRALAITAAFLVTILVAFLTITGFGMGDTLNGKNDKTAPAQTSSPATPADANSTDSSADSRKYVPGYYPTREEKGLPPAKPCESCGKKHRK
jgi:hypothetical protein